jgi:hypothetical protein
VTATEVPINAAVLYANRKIRDRGAGSADVDSALIDADLLLSNCVGCRIAEPASCARFEAIDVLPLLKDVRNWPFGVRGNLLHSRDALGAVVYTRDRDAACRGSIVEGPGGREPKLGGREVETQQDANCASFSAQWKFIG